MSQIRLVYVTITTRCPSLKSSQTRSSGFPVFTLLPCDNAITVVPVIGLLIKGKKPETEIMKKKVKDPLWKSWLFQIWCWRHYHNEDQIHWSLLDTRTVALAAVWPGKLPESRLASHFYLERNWLESWSVTLALEPPPQGSRVPDPSAHKNRRPSWTARRASAPFPVGELCFCRSPDPPLRSHPSVSPPPRKWHDTLQRTAFHRSVSPSRRVALKSIE